MKTKTKTKTNSQRATEQLMQDGLKVRKQVLTAEYVDRQLANADAFTMPIQELATTAAWGMVWTRPGLPHKTRSMLNIAFLTALGRQDELKLHIGAALRNGVTQQEIQEILMQAAMYCGFPAALEAFRIARGVLAEAKAAKPAKKTRSAIRRR